MKKMLILTVIFICFASQVLAANWEIKSIKKIHDKQYVMELFDSHNWRNVRELTLTESQFSKLKKYFSEPDANKLVGLQFLGCSNCSNELESKDEGGDIIKTIFALK